MATLFFIRQLMSQIKESIVYNLEVNYNSNMVFLTDLEILAS